MPFLASNTGGGGGRAGAFTIDDIFLYNFSHFRAIGKAIFVEALCFPPQQMLVLLFRITSETSEGTCLRVPHHLECFENNSSQ